MTSAPLAVLHQPVALVALEVAVLDPEARPRGLSVRAGKPREVVAPRPRLLGCDVDLQVPGLDLLHGEVGLVVLLRTLPGAVLPDDDVPNPPLPLPAEKAAILPPHECDVTSPDAITGQDADAVVEGLKRSVRDRGQQVAHELTVSTGEPHFTGRCRSGIYRRGVDYLMTDARVQRIREEPVRVAYDGHVLIVQASERLSRLELFERRAELEVLLGDEVVAYIARDSAEQRLFWSARMFDVGILGFGSNTLMSGIHAALGQH
jgi:hypothetical protein